MFIKSKRCFHNVTTFNSPGPTLCAWLCGPFETLAPFLLHWTERVCCLRWPFLHSLSLSVHENIIMMHDRPAGLQNSNCGCNRSPYSPWMSCLPANQAETCLLNLSTAQLQLSHNTGIPRDTHWRVLDSIYRSIDKFGSSWLKFLIESIGDIGKRHNR